MDRKVLQKNANKTIYRDGDKVIKVYSDTYSITQVLNEALNQSKIAEAGICAPRVYEVKQFDGKFGIVMDYIEGDNLAVLIKNDKSNIDKYIDIFVSTHYKLMSNKSLNLNNSYGRIKNKIFASELPANIKYGLFYRLRDMEFSRDVIHGDFNPSNIIIEKNGHPFVLDWSHVAFGDKTFDIAVTYALFDINGEHDLADKYLIKICESESILKEQVLKEINLAYIYIVDRYDSEKKKEIYNRISEIIKCEEA